METKTPEQLVLPLTAKARDGTMDLNSMKLLRNMCANGENYQNLILENLDDAYFTEQIQTEKPLLTIVFQLCNNLCIENQNSQDRLVHLVFPLIKSVEWEPQSATAALMFINTCTQPESPHRNELTIDLIEPFLYLPDNDEFDFILISILPAIAADVIPYIFNHQDICLITLDRIHDAIEFHPELFEPRSFIAALLEQIRKPTLPVHTSKSKIVGVFAAIVGCSGPARYEAIQQGAVELFKSMKKNDLNDPILLEWSVAALRFMVGEFVHESERNESTDKSVYDAPDEPN